MMRLLCLSLFIIPLSLPNGAFAQSACPTRQYGDADCDGKIGLVDVEIFRREFNKQDLKLDADFSGDGKVSLVDFEILRRNYGKSFQAADNSGIPPISPSRSVAPSVTLKPNHDEQNEKNQIGDDDDISNQEENTITRGLNSFWFGSGRSKDKSYTGLRFKGLKIPRVSKIVSAKILVFPKTDQWARMSFEVRGEAKGDSTPLRSVIDFEALEKTASTVNHFSYTRWEKGKWVELEDITPIIQELVNRPDWSQGQAVTLVFKSTEVITNSRKFAASHSGDPSLSPKLSITYIAP